MKNEARLRENIKGKRILYLATKNSDYIRVSQEIDMAKELGKSVEVIAFPDKKYLTRILKVYAKLLATDIKQYDVVIVGFMAQMILPVFMWKLRKKVIITDFFISIYDTLVFDRKKFPIIWHDMNEEEFYKNYGIKGMLYCHSNGKLCIVQNEEIAKSIIRLT